MGISLNRMRRIGLLWGPDITEKFLCSITLRIIVRSYEGPDARNKQDNFLCMDNGYTVDHQVESGLLITVFSAPDYLSSRNLRTCSTIVKLTLCLSPPDFATPHLCSFEAVIEASTCERGILQLPGSN